MGELAAKEGLSCCVGAPRRVECVEALFTLESPDIVGAVLLISVLVFIGPLGCRLKELT